MNNLSNQSNWFRIFEIWSQLSEQQQQAYRSNFETWRLNYAGINVLGISSRKILYLEAQGIIDSSLFAIAVLPDGRIRINNLEGIMASR